MKDQRLVLYWHLRMQIRDADEADKNKGEPKDSFLVQALKSIGLN